MFLIKRKRVSLFKSTKCQRKPPITLRADKSIRSCAQASPMTTNSRHHLEWHNGIRVTWCPLSQVVILLNFMNNNSSLKSILFTKWINEAISTILSDQSTLLVLQVRLKLFKWSDSCRCFHQLFGFLPTPIHELIIDSSARSDIHENKGAYFSKIYAPSSS